MPNRIIVLGTMRSGTSLTAELVRQWGAYSGGDDKLWKSDINDPRGYGYMEYIPLQELNDELLDHNDRLPPLQHTMEQHALHLGFREKAQALLKDMDGQAVKNNLDTWVWKDARLPLTLPFWVQCWGDPVYVVTIRHPADVALSSAKTEELDPNNLPFSAGLAYWQYCMLNILSFTQENHRKIFLSYEQLLSSPTQECERLCDFLDEHCQKAKVDSRQRIDKMSSRITRNQRHHYYHKSLAQMEQSTREQRALYDFLRVKTMHPEEPFRKDDFALYPGWREYLQAMDLILTLSNSNSS